MSLSRILTCAAIVVVVIAIPGPSVLFTISRALTAGRRTALLTVAGNAMGLVLQVIAVAFGMGTLVERSAEVFTGLKLAGAAYLVLLGIQTLRRRRSFAAGLFQPGRPLRALRAVRDGVLVGAMNPKTIAVMVALLPQFAVPSSGHLVLQLLVLGLLFPLIAVVLDSVWAVAGGAAREWLLRSPRRLAAVGGAGGLTLIGAGIGLAATGRKD